MSGTCSRCDADITYGLCDECHEASDNKATAALLAAREIQAALENERDVARDEMARMESVIDASDRLGVEIAMRRGQPYDRYACWGESTMHLADEIAELVVDSARAVETAEHERDSALDMVRETVRGLDAELASVRPAWPQRTEYLASEGARRWYRSLDDAHADGYDQRSETELVNLMRVGYRAVQVGQ